MASKKDSSKASATKNALVTTQREQREKISQLENKLEYTMREVNGLCKIIDSHIRDQRILILSLGTISKQVGLEFDEKNPNQSAARICEAIGKLSAPVDMRIVCPACSSLHVDEGEFEKKPHHTHACQHCGHVWRPAIVATRGVRFLPGFKNRKVL